MTLIKSTVTSNGKKIKTLDNPLNTWVRDLKTSKLVPNDKALKNVKK